MDTLGLINIECLSLKIVIKLYPTWWKNSTILLPGTILERNQSNKECQL